MHRKAEGSRQSQDQYTNTQQHFLQGVQEGKGTVERALDEIGAANTLCVDPVAKRLAKVLRVAQVGLAIGDNLVRQHAVTPIPQLRL